MRSAKSKSAKRTFRNSSLSFVVAQVFCTRRQNNTPHPTTLTLCPHPKNVYAFQQNIFTARVVYGQAPAKDVVQRAMRDDDDHRQSGRERLAENNRRKRRRDEEISVERSPTGGYSRHVWLCRRGGKDYIMRVLFTPRRFRCIF